MTQTQTKYAGKIPASDKLRFFAPSVRRHWLSLLAMFFTFGLGIVWLALAKEAPMMLPVIGLIFSGFVLVFCLGTMPSRLMFYYEQQVVAKYGRRAEAIVTHAHSEVLDDAVTLYHFDYEFSNRKTRQFGTFYLEDSNLAALLSVRSTVPIKFLAFAPTQSEVRMRSLKGKLK